MWLRFFDRVFPHSWRWIPSLFNWTSSCLAESLSMQLVYVYIYMYICVYIENVLFALPPPPSFFFFFRTGTSSLGSVVELPVWSLFFFSLSFLKIPSHHEKAGLLQTLEEREKKRRDIRRFKRTACACCLKTWKAVGRDMSRLFSVCEQWEPFSSIRMIAEKIKDVARHGSASLYRLSLLFPLSHFPP